MDAAPSTLFANCYMGNVAFQYLTFWQRLQWNLMFGHWLTTATCEILCFIVATVTHEILCFSISCCLETVTHDILCFSISQFGNCYHKILCFSISWFGNCCMWNPVFQHLTGWKLLPRNPVFHHIMVWKLLHMKSCISSYHGLETVTYKILCFTISQFWKQLHMKSCVSAVQHLGNCYSEIWHSVWWLSHWLV